MSRAPIHGSPRTPVTVPETGRDKGGIRALGFVSVGSVWSLGIFESSQFDLPLYAFMNMSRTLELFRCLELFRHLIFILVLWRLLHFCMHI